MISDEIQTTVFNSPSLSLRVSYVSTASEIIPALLRTFSPVDRLVPVEHIYFFPV